MKPRTTIALGIASIVAVFVIVLVAGNKIADTMEGVSNSMNSNADRLDNHGEPTSDMDVLRSYGNQYDAKPILLSDFMLDSRRMRYQRIVTAGFYHQLNESAWLTNEQLTGNFLVNVNIKNLTREERAALLSCDDCTVIIVGIVDTVELERGIVAEKAVVSNS